MSLPVLWATALSLALTAPSQAQQFARPSAQPSTQSSIRRAALQPEFVRGIEGSLLFASHGPQPDCVLQAFLHLCHSGKKDIVVIRPQAEGAIPTERWTQLGAHSVHVLEALPSSAKDLVLPMLRASGVWFDGPLERMEEHELFVPLLRSVMERGGVVGGADEGALALAHFRTTEGAKQPVRGVGLLPNAVLQFTGAGRSDHPAIPGDGMVTWSIPESSALVVHHGRRVGALGANDVRVQLAPHNGWPARSAQIESVDVFSPGDLPSYGQDLLSWLRSAQERQGPVYPSEAPGTPNVEQGTLFLHGGSGVNDSTFELFIAAAGGKESPFVCIPSASEIGEGEEPSSYSARALRNLGCENVVILHTNDPEVADKDMAFLAPLQRATGVWIDGGRTFRVMDSYEHTRAHELLRGVLARKGAVGGSSAGCQVVGDYLVRGNPQTNQDLVFEGYTSGFQFLKGVIVDAHFRQRERESDLAGLVGLHPQMLGIGVDERTALIVRGSIGEVVGENAVSFYAANPAGTSGGDSAPSADEIEGSVVILKSGATYHLVDRKTLK